MMNVSYTMDANKRITVKIDNAPFYSSDEIGDLEAAVGITIGVSLTSVGIRTVYNYEVKFDNITVTKPAEPMVARSFGERTQHGTVFSEDNEMKRLPGLKDIQQAQTLGEVLQRILNK